MTYKEFIDQIKDLIPFNQVVNHEGGWSCASTSYKGDHYVVVTSEEGYDGGNCWGDDAEWFSHYAEDETTYLENILEKIGPDTSFLQHKKLSKIREPYSHFEQEYYGNETTYKGYLVDLEKLYGKMVEMEILT